VMLAAVISVKSMAGSDIPDLHGGCAEAYENGG